MDWEKFNNILMTTKGIKYLTDYEMSADLGITYTELRSVMSNWSYKLHTKGHIMEESELGMIFEKGILTWYVKYFMNKVSMILNLSKTKQDTEINNPTFWRFKQYCEFAKAIDYKFPNSFKIIMQYPNYQKYIINNNCKYSSFKEWLYETQSMEDYNILLEFVHINQNKIIESMINNEKIIKNVNDINDYISSCNLNIDDIIDIININYKNVIDMGIIFQRWKIIIEKIQGIAESKIDDILEKSISINLITLDRLITRLQEMIFHMVKYICLDIIIQNINGDKIKISKIKPDIIYNHSTYKLIDKMISNKDHILHKPLYLYDEFKHTHLLENLDITDL